MIAGIHHVTAIARHPGPNLNFYLGVLGLRLVKRTVNFDDPGTYHLYYGNELGQPGTILTFFPMPDVSSGRHGTGQATVAAFSVPEQAVGFWQQRLQQAGVEVAGPVTRFGELVIGFSDPDGLQLELVFHAGAEARPAWAGGPVPEACAVRGFHGVTLSEAAPEGTTALLTETMGLHLLASAGNRFRYAAGSGRAGSLVDVLVLPSERRGWVGVGTVHHVAFRVPDDAQQQAWREELVTLGYNVSPVMDRKYFHSIYFREPGGVLFELATDPPGFATDEVPERLGTGLKLPPWLEPARAQIEQVLPPLQLP